PEHVINFLFFIAEELREIMAELGFAKLQDMVGQTQVLEFADVSDHWKARHLDLSVILHRPEVGPNVALHRVTSQDHELEKSLDQTKLIELVRPALDSGKKVSAELSIDNV